ncbi:hypothetical protein GN956_G5340 [Arapaima gigas]
MKNRTVFSNYHVHFGGLNTCSTFVPFLQESSSSRESGQRGAKTVLGAPEKQVGCDKSRDVRTAQGRPVVTSVAGWDG